MTPRLIVVGLGTQDSLKEAIRFVTKYKMTSTHMFWDNSGDTWAAYRVVSQPSALLIRDGVIVKRWSGPLDEHAVEAALK